MVKIPAQKRGKGVDGRAIFSYNKKDKIRFLFAFHCKAVLRQAEDFLGEREIMKKYTVMKLITLLLYCAVTAFLAVTLAISAGADPETASRGIGLAVWIVVFWLIIGGSGYLVTTLCALITAIVAAKRGVPRGARAFFIAFSILPVVTEGLFYLAVMLIA